MFRGEGKKEGFGGVWVRGCWDVCDSERKMMMVFFCARVRELRVSRLLCSVRYVCECCDGRWNSHGEWSLGVWFGARELVLGTQLILNTFLISFHVGEEFKIDFGSKRIWIEIILSNFYAESKILYWILFLTWVYNKDIQI